MFLASLLLATLTTQKVADSIPQAVRTRIERTETEYRFVEVMRFDTNDVLIWWRLRNPPPANVVLPKGVRDSRELVRVHITDCIDGTGAKERFSVNLSKVGKDGTIYGLGDAAVYRQDGDGTETTVDFRQGRYLVSVSAPTGPAARRFAWAVDEALGDQLLLPGFHRIPEGVPDAILTAVSRERADVEFLEVSCEATGNTTMRWRLREPPAAAASESEADRLDREFVVLSFTTCKDTGAAEGLFREAVSAIGGRKNAVQGLGEQSCLYSKAGEDSVTHVAFRSKQHYGIVRAPNASLARQLALAVDQAFRGVADR